MKKFTIAIAAAGLLSLGACHGRTSEGANVQNEADMVADNMENASDNMQAAADNSSNAMAANMMQNAADNMQSQADNVRDDGKAQADNVDAAVKGKK